MMLAEGEQATTKTGRLTTPFPRIDLSTNRRALNTVKRVDNWLMQNAIDEANAGGDDYNALMFKSNLNNIQQADKDSAEYYLFGTIHGS